ncbi:hypothetical protein DTL42_07060 [Bremerella cremea]|uniref:ParB-like N-terminal domain-containing protein n=1 Tax=Bremerella cremea TaxID=1031537 RepID=A0A368KWP8_9BACT|nr:ParB N-terminal domain-containing protein [Bremerella cremea]RCS54863.1 hypothetical protein DTL42_07060 [Bremerella cremea]
MIVKPENVPAATPTWRRVSLSQIDLVENRRPLDEENLRRLEPSIAENGVLQPVGLVAVGNRFLLCIGNHRHEVTKRLGHTEIDALVWPEGTPPEQMLVFSLHENHLRKDESVEDTFKRVTELARYHRCSFTEAAVHACVTPGTLSKIRKSVGKLCPEALKVARENKIGVAITYEVARRAKTEDEQTAWLKEHAAGRMSRDAIIRMSGGKKSKAPKQVTFELKMDEVAFQLTFPRTISYEELFDAIAKLKAGIQVHAKQNLPIHVLAEVMA